MQSVKWTSWREPQTAWGAREISWSHKLGTWVLKDTWGASRYRRAQGMHREKQLVQRSGGRKGTDATPERRGLGLLWGRGP